MKLNEQEPTSCVPIARKRVIAFVERTGRLTFSFADVNVKPGTMFKLVGRGYIVRSTTKKHKKSIRTIYLLSAREKRIWIDRMKREPVDCADECDIA